MSPPTAADVTEAAGRLAGIAVATPLLESPLLNARLGGRLLVKAECLQRTGSFKVRGAYNRIARLGAAERARGVLAFSSGNHAQAVAHVAARLGIRATIVMPADAPRLKIGNTRAYGAEVVLYDRAREDREAIARRLAAETGAVVVAPYEDPDVIAGQGTVGREIAAALGDAAPDQVLVPCSGGGLAAGCALALKDAWPGVAVWSVEPAGYDDTARSLASGRRERIDPDARSFCDALLVPTPGEISFAVNRALLAGGLAVTDAEVAAAMRAAFEAFKLVVEPGGAVGLAAALCGRVQTGGRTTVAVLSGGNVDASVFCTAIAG